MLQASCAQASRAISRKSFPFNLVFENKRVTKIFGSGTMCTNVPPHAWSPPSFPHSEQQAKDERTHTPSKSLDIIARNDDAFACVTRVEKERSSSM